MTPEQRRRLGIALLDEDLTREQRAWRPATVGEARAQWPHYDRAELWGDHLHYDRGPRGADWRSIAIALRSYPGWRAAMFDSGTVAIVPPHGWDTFVARQERRAQAQDERGAQAGRTSRPLHT